MATSTQINELDKNIQAVKAAGPPSSSMPPLVSFPMAGNIDNMSRRFDNGFAAPTSPPAQTPAQMAGVVPEGPSRMNSAVNAAAGIGYLPGALIRDAAVGLNKVGREVINAGVLRPLTGTEMVPDKMKFLTPDLGRVIKNDTMDALQGVIRPVAGATKKSPLINPLDAISGKFSGEGTAPVIPGTAAAPTGPASTAHSQWIDAFANNKFDRPIEMKMPEGLMHISTDGAKAKTIYVPTGSVPADWKAPKGVKVVQYNPQASYLKDQGAPAGPGGVVNASAPGGPQKMTSDGMMEISKQLTKLANNNGVVGGAYAGPTYHGQPYAEVFGKDYSPADPGLPPPDRSSSEMAREHMAKLGKAMDYLLAKQQEGKLLAPGMDVMTNIGREMSTLSGNDQTNAINSRKVATDEALVPSQRFGNYASGSAQLQSAGRESGGNKDYTTLNAVLNGYTKAHQEILKQDNAPEIEREKLRALQDVYAPLFDQFGGGKAGGGEPAEPGVSGQRGKFKSKAEASNYYRGLYKNLSPKQLNSFVQQTFPDLP